MDYKTAIDDEYFRMNVKEQMVYFNTLMDETGLDMRNAIEFMKVMFLGTIAECLDPESNSLWEICDSLDKLAKCVHKTSEGERFCILGEITSYEGY